MKKFAPLALSALLLATGPAFALDASSAPDVKAPDAQQSTTTQTTLKTETQTETQAEADKTPASKDTATEAKDAAQSQTGLSQDGSSQSPASPVLENQTSPDKLPASQSDQPAAGQAASSTNPDSPDTNVQKLFSMFHPKQQADAPQQTTPASTPNAQTQQ